MLCQPLHRWGWTEICPSPGAQRAPGGREVAFRLQPADMGVQLPGTGLGTGSGLAGGWDKGRLGKAVLHSPRARGPCTPRSQVPLRCLCPTLFQPSPFKWGTSPPWC